MFACSDNGQYNIYEETLWVFTHPSEVSVNDPFTVKVLESESNLKEL